MSAEIEVPFAGAGSGEAALTWGQRSMCDTMRRERSWLPMGGRRPVPPGTTLADLVDDLRYALARFQSLRTRLRLDGPAQVVATSGVTRLEVITVDGEDPAAAAARVERDFRGAEPDLEHDWPMRMAAICVGTTPAWVVTIMPHLVTDGTGAGILLDETARRLATPTAGLQPLDLAAWQASPAGARTHGAAQRHWERHAALLDPFSGVPPTRVTAAPRYRKCLFRSPGLAAALPVVAARAGIAASTVLLTAFLTALAQLTGERTVAARQMVNNRFRSGLSDVVTPVAQLGLCVADVSNGFAGSLDGVARATMSARKHAYYDPARVPEAFTACLNDRRGAGAPDRVLQDVGLLWSEPPVGPTEPLFVHVDDVDGALQLTLDVDTAVFSPDDVESCARGIDATVTSLVTA